MHYVYKTDPTQRLPFYQVLGSNCKIDIFLWVTKYLFSKLNDFKDVFNVNDPLMTKSKLQTLTEPDNRDLYLIVEKTIYWIYIYIY